MSRIKVLHLMNGFWDASISRIVLGMVTHLGTANYDWHVAGLCGEGTLADHYRQLGAQAIDLSAPGPGGSNTVSRLRCYAYEHEIQIVHTHTARTIIAAKRALLANKTAAHVATKHLLYFPSDRRLGLLYMVVDWLCLYLPDHVVAVSNTMRSQVLRLPGMSADRVTAIPNGVDVTRFQVPEQRDSCRAELGLPAENTVIGFTGRLAPVKRLDMLLEAFAGVHSRYPYTSLLLVGEGESRDDLEALAAQLGITHSVVFTGFRADIPRLLAAMDIFIQSSSNEGLSLSLLEAMAAGKPVIATTAGGTAEVISHGQNGLLVEQNSVSALEQALDLLLSTPDLSRQLGAAAQQYVASAYDIGRVMDAYAALYERLVTQRKKCGQVS